MKYPYEKRETNSTGKAIVEAAKDFEKSTHMAFGNAFLRNEATMDKQAESTLPSQASISYDEEKGTVSMHQPGWYSPELSPPAAYAMASKYYDSWEAFKEEHGITNMRPIDFNDKYYIVIGGKGASSRFNDNVSERIQEDLKEQYPDAPEEALWDVDYDYDAIEDKVIEDVWSKQFGTEDANEVGEKIDELEGSEDMMWAVQEAFDQATAELVTLPDLSEAKAEEKPEVVSEEKVDAPESNQE